MVPAFAFLGYLVCCQVCAWPASPRCHRGNSSPFSLQAEDLAKSIYTAWEMYGMNAMSALHRLTRRLCSAADSALWDPRYHGSVMMVPVLYCTCVLTIMAATFVLFVGLRLWQHRVKKQPFRAHTKETQDEEEVGPASHTATHSLCPVPGWSPSSTPQLALQQPTDMIQDR